MGTLRGSSHRKERMTETITTKAEPDPIALLTPFTHPYVRGDDYHTDPSCMYMWKFHFWVDCGDHGYTVCPDSFINSLRAFKERLNKETEHE